ncbi:Methyltransferase domain [Musa troglodytarum]|uniref:Methyltransferase domain n=1 Tax=Musa troglodytarum TaxID=320322 RepID=A0A9E7HTA1_9LILI|nr:Methyltransferase domain [Musa troglodytarum]
MATVRPPPLLPRIAAVSSSHSDPSRAAGQIKRLVLTSEGRTKLNTAPDRDFYAFPRFVTHVDAAFISALRGLYRERLASGWAVLDLDDGNNDDGMGVDVTCSQVTSPGPRLAKSHGACPPWSGLIASGQSTPNADRGMSPSRTPTEACRHPAKVRSSIQRQLPTSGHIRKK